jgi:phosphocarrier protein FPr
MACRPPTSYQLDARSLCRHAGTAPVSVCGEIAAYSVAVPVLVGLGVDSLRIAAPAVAAVKHRIRGIDAQQATKLARKALRCASPAEVRALISQADIPT